MRVGGQLPDDPDLHRVLLTYASDFYYISTSLLPAGRSVASLNRAPWFHCDFRLAPYLSYKTNNN